MTDKECEKLVTKMREAGVKYRTSKPVIELLEGGADTIERLKAERDAWHNIVDPLRKQIARDRMRALRDLARSTAKELVDNQGRG